MLKQHPMHQRVISTQFMTEYLEPASDVIWGLRGPSLPKKEKSDLQPTTDEGWLNVVHAATVVAEGGNLMMMPGLANGESDWNEYAQGLTRAALLGQIRRRSPGR